MTHDPYEVLRSVGAVGGRGRRSADGHVARAVGRRGLAIMGTAFIAAGVVTCTSVSAFAGSGSLAVVPATGLAKHQIVMVNGTGLPAHSRGWLIECNMAPKEPTVVLGSPVNATIPVGCSPPSLRAVYSTSASGVLSDTFVVLLGRLHVGPPCGLNASDAACPPLDSKGGRPGQDAQSYPCPPTPAQQVAGVTCAVQYIDASGLRVSAPISFAGGGPSATGGSGGGGSGGGGSGGSTTTKPGHATTTTKPTAVTTKPPGIVVANQTGATVPHATTQTTPVSSTHLAYTGPGQALRMVFAAGVAMTMVGAGLWLLQLRRRTAASRR